jgi:hypothetical protein
MKIMKSRGFMYIIMIGVYILFWKIAGFEFTCIVMGGTIIGEQVFIHAEKESKKDKK